MSLSTYPDGCVFRTPIICHQQIHCQNSTVASDLGNKPGRCLVPARRSCSRLHSFQTFVIHKPPGCNAVQDPDQTVSITRNKMWSKKVEPEQYFLPSTPHVPNSRLPILVYRNALSDTSPRNILNTIEPNGWLMGGQWKTYKVPHFHADCHECYGIIKGKTTYLLGLGPVDPQFNTEGEPNGMKLTVEKGDVFVLPVRPLLWHPVASWVSVVLII